MTLRFCFGLLLVIGLASCAQPIRPDLQRLYEMKSGDAAQPPVIIIHGVLGSKLADPALNIEAWPGRLLQILFGRYTRLTLDIDPDTLEPTHSPYQPVAINQSILGRDYYGRILQALGDIGGYRPTATGTTATPGERRYYTFLYDWRQDVVDTARQLHAFIGRVRDDFGQPDMQVDIIAHSLGGLVARYYVRYGKQDVLDKDHATPTNAGGQNVRRLVLLGVPNFGSAVAFRTLDQGYRVGLGSIPPETTATFPSTYQVLPHPIRAALMDLSGKTLNYDLFDADFWRIHKLSIFHPTVRKRIRAQFERADQADTYMQTLERFFEKRLERGRRFSLALSRQMAQPTVFPVVFGGDCIETPSLMVIENNRGQAYVRLKPGELQSPNGQIDYHRLMLDPGDGTVTKASLLAKQTSDPAIARNRQSFFPMHHGVFMCHEHSQLTNNIHFQDNLLHTLLSVDPLTVSQP